MAKKKAKAGRKAGADAANPESPTRQKADAEFRRRGLLVYERLKDYADRAEISGAEIGRRAKIRANLLTDWNKRTPRGRGPSFGELSRIAEVLGVDLRDAMADALPAEPTPLTRYARRAYKIVAQLARDARRFERAIRELEAAARGAAAEAAAEPDPGTMAIPGEPTIGDQRRNGGEANARRCADEARKPQRRTGDGTS